MPKENENPWKISEQPFLKIELKFKENQKKKKKKQDEDLIYFEPSYEKVREQLKEPIVWLLEFINSMKKLEADIVKVLGIPPVNIFHLTEEYSTIKSAYDKIDNFL